MVRVRLATQEKARLRLGLFSFTGVIAIGVSRRVGNGAERAVPTRGALFCAPYDLTRFTSGQSTSSSATTHSSLSAAVSHSFHAGSAITASM